MFLRYWNRLSNTHPKSLCGKGQWEGHFRKAGVTDSSVDMHDLKNLDVHLPSLPKQQTNRLFPLCFRPKDPTAQPQEGTAGAIQERRDAKDILAGDPLQR